MARDWASKLCSIHGIVHSIDNVNLLIIIYMIILVLYIFVQRISIVLSIQIK